MSLQIARLLNRSLAIASVALVIHVGTAAAADPAGDIHQQTNASLTGGTKANDAHQSGPRESKMSDPIPDAQELARRLLLGTNRPSAADAQTIKPESASAGPEIEQQKRPFVYGDAQAAAQQLLLGQQQTGHILVAVEPKSEKRPVVYGDAQLAAQQMLLGTHPVSEVTPRTARAMP